MVAPVVEFEVKCQLEKIMKQMRMDESWPDVEVYLLHVDVDLRRTYRLITY